MAHSTTTIWWLTFQEICIDSRNQRFFTKAFLEIFPFHLKLNMWSITSKIYNISATTNSNNQYDFWKQSFILPFYVLSTEDSFRDTVWRKKNLTILGQWFSEKCTMLYLDNPEHLNHLKTTRNILRACSKIYPVFLLILVFHVATWQKKLIFGLIVSILVASFWL